MLILGIDYETTGTPTKPPMLPTECAAVLVDTSNWRILESFSTVINPGIEVEEYYRNFANLTEHQIRTGSERFAAAVKLYSLMGRCDAVLTWNGDEFDRIIALEEFYQAGFAVPDVRWIDLKIEGLFKNSLLHTAAELGYLISGPHTALHDCFGMIEVLKRSGFDVNQLVEDALYPYVEVSANVSYHTKEKASSQNFKYCPVRQMWVRKIRQHRVEEVCKKFGFSVRIESQIGKEPPREEKHDEKHQFDRPAT